MTTGRRTFTVRWAARIASLAGLAGAAIALAAIVVAGGSSSYTVYADFHDAGGLVNGFAVRVDGAPVGRVASLSLGRNDLAVAKLELDRSAAPIGRDASATIQAADLLGEKYVALDPGNRQDPAPSGTVIPPARTGLGVELDDVLNAFDPSIQDALRSFLNEQGTAYVGRHQNLAALLSVLPQSLTQTRQLLAEFGQDNAALGQFLDQSDQVVTAVAGQRAELGRLVGATAGTLSTLASRGAQLGQTVARAPAALQSMRHALAALQGAAIPLAPAARGLAATAGPLTATLDELPAFATAAAPTLNTITRVAPTLRRLGVQGTPVVAKLHSITNELGTFSAALDPVTTTLDHGIGDVLGVLEGWARATQTRDAASHVFRFGVAIGAQTFDSLLPLLQTVAAGRAGKHRTASPLTGRPHLSTHAPNTGAAPAKPGLPLPVHVPPPPGLQSTVQHTQSTVHQLLGALGLSGSQASHRPGAGDSSNGSNLQSLLNYLLK
jgi:virulence factor Mce-like protein